MKINPKRLTIEQLREIKKILIVQQKPFGDILLNTGYFKELRRNFPKCQIDYLIQRPFKTILDGNPHLDNLLLMDKPQKGWRYFIPYIKVIRQIRKEKYDLVIDQLRGTSSARIVFFSGIKYRLGHKLKPKVRMGLKFNRWNWLYNLKVPRGNVRYYSRFKFDLLAPLGIVEVEHNTQYFVTDDSFRYIENWLLKNGLFEEQLIAFSPGTPVRKKQWRLDHYAQLGDLIVKNLNYKIVVLWGPGEKEDAEFIINNMHVDALLAPSTTFNQAGAFLKKMKVLICNDGGINHLAVSLDVPSISIFGAKSTPDKWCAWHKPQYIYLKDWDFTDLNDNSFNIKPELVYQKLIDHLNNKENRNLNELAYRQL